MSSSCLCCKRRRSWPTPCRRYLYFLTGLFVCPEWQLHYGSCRSYSIKTYSYACIYYVAHFIIHIYICIYTLIPSSPRRHHAPNIRVEHGTSICELYALSDTLTWALSTNAWQVTTIGQIAMLEPAAQGNKAERPVCVVNTHLFYHPRAPHIRLLQISVLLREAELFIEEYVHVFCSSCSFLF